MLFEKLLAFSRADGLAIRWGLKGFSMNVNVAGLREWLRERVQAVSEAGCGS